MHNDSVCDYSKRVLHIDSVFGLLNMCSAYLVSFLTIEYVFFILNKGYVFFLFFFLIFFCRCSVARMEDLGFFDVL